MTTPSLSGIFSRLFLLIVTVGMLLFLYIRAAHQLLAMDSGDWHFPPTQLEDIHHLLQHLQRNAASHQLPVFLLYCSGYLLKQTFAIPGSAMMNLLGGALYGPWLGTCLVSVLTALGSTGCYWISWKVGRPVVERWFKERVLAFKRQLSSHESDLFWYLVFSRAFPFTPNWFLNMASPHVGIRVSWFFTSILMGLLPYNFITTSAGDVLSELSSLNDIMAPSTVFKLILIACVFLLMPLMKRKLMKSPDKKESLVRHAD